MQVTNPTLRRTMLRRMLDNGPFRLIGVGISALVAAEEDGSAPGLFTDTGAAQAKAEQATDAIRARFGKDAIVRGRALR